MASLQHIQRLFSLDTLDPRFTASSKALPANEQLLSDNPRAGASNDGHSFRAERDTSTVATAGIQPSRWKTPEFMVYAAVCLIAIPLMIKSAYDVSKRTYLDLGSWQG